MKTPFPSLVWGVCGTIAIAMFTSASQAQQEAVYRLDHQDGYAIVKLFVPADQQSVEGVVIDVYNYEKDGWLVGQTVLNGQVTPNGILGAMDLWHAKLGQPEMPTSEARFIIDESGFSADPYPLGVFPLQYYRIQLQPNNFVDESASPEGLWRLRSGDNMTVVNVVPGDREYNWEAEIVECSLPEFIGQNLFELNIVGTGMYYGRWQITSQPLGSWCLAESASIFNDGSLGVNIRGNFGSATELFDRVTPQPPQEMARMEGKWVLRPELANLEVTSGNGRFVATLDWPQAMVVQMAGVYSGDDYTFNWTAVMPDGQELHGTGSATLAVDGGSLVGQLLVPGYTEPQGFTWRIIERNIYTRQYY